MRGIIEYVIMVMAIILYYSAAWGATGHQQVGGVFMVCGYHPGGDIGCVAHRATWFFEDEAECAAALKAGILSRSENLEQNGWIITAEAATCLTFDTAKTEEL